MNVVLVGNGPSIKEQKLGKLIDSFDVVVRFNYFTTEGFEEHTGTKIDVWAINGPDLVELWNQKYNRPSTIIYIPETQFDQHNWDAWNARKLPDNVEMCPKHVACEATQWVKEKYNGTTSMWISTGGLAAFHWSPCSIVGFDSFSRSDHHYWSADKTDSRGFSGVHVPEIERTWLSRLNVKRL